MKLACYFVVFSLMVYASGSMKTGIANEISTENRKGNRIKYMMLDSVKGSVMETTNKAGETTPLLKALQYTKNMYDYYEHFQKLKDVIIFKYFLFTSALRFMRYCPEIWDQANQLANNFHNWEEVRSRGLSIFSYIFYENILPDLPSIENIIPTILTILGVNQQILPKSYHNIGPSIVQLKSLLSKMYNKTRYGDANTEFSEMKNILPIGLDLLYNGYDCAPDIAIAIINSIYDNIGTPMLETLDGYYNKTSQFVSDTVTIIETQSNNYGLYMIDMKDNFIHYLFESYISFINIDWSAEWDNIIIRFQNLLTFLAEFDYINFLENLGYRMIVNGENSLDLIANFLYESKQTAFGWFIQCIYRREQNKYLVKQAYYQCQTYIYIYIEL